MHKVTVNLKPLPRLVSIMEMRTGEYGIVREAWGAEPIGKVICKISQYEIVFVENPAKEGTLSETEELYWNIEIVPSGTKINITVGE